MTQKEPKNTDTKHDFILTASKMALRSDILETIFFITSNNSFVYNAEPLNNLLLANAIISIAEKMSINISILVEASQIETKKKYYSRTKKYGNVLSITDFKTSELNGLIILDDLVGVNQYIQFEKMTKEIFESNIVIGLVNSPFLFLDLIRAGLSMCCFTTVKYDESTRNFYKILIEDSNVISFTSFENSMKELPISDYYNKLSGKNKEIFESLNRNGIYAEKIYKELVKDINPLQGYTSDKLNTLRKIIKILKDRKNCVIVKSEQICNHILFYFGGDKKLETIEVNSQVFNVDVEIIPHSKLNIFDENNFDNIIFFDFYPIKVTKTRYILCGPNDKKLFKKLLTAEEIIETEIKPKIESNMNILKDIEDEEISLEGLKPNEQRLYQFKIMLVKDTFKKVKEKLQSMSMKVFFKGHYAAVYLKTIDPFATSFLLSKILNLPVHYPQSQVYPFINIQCNMFSSGHINYYNSFVVGSEFRGLGFLFFDFARITFFYFSKKMNIRINIESQNLERNLYVHCTLESLFLHFALKYYPKVYNHKPLSAIEFGIIKTTSMAKKFGLLESLEWERASINECKFFENTYDLRFEVNLNTYKCRPSEIKYDNTLNNLFGWYKRNNKKNGRYHNNALKNHYNLRNNENYHNRDNDSIFIEKFTFSIQALLNKIIQYDINPIITEVIENHRVGKKLIELRRELQVLNFADYYFVEILFTKKERFIDNKINDAGIFKDGNIKNLVNFLDMNLKNRFDSVEEIFERYKIYSLNHKDNDSHDEAVRQVVVTPFRIKCLYPQASISNRVLRNFDKDKFIRVSFKDENEKQISKGTTRDNTQIYDNIKKVMKNGILIGQRKYFFLAMSSSQLKLHSAWFVTPYMLNGTLIGADYIRSWLGDFKPIHNIGKYAVRLGQGLSSTIDTVKINDIKEIDDIERNGYCFSDGIGQISYELALEVSKFLKVSKPPSAFQIRIGGFKGVVSVLQNSKFNVLGKRSRMEQKINEVPNSINNQDKFTISLRKSMKKFESNHKILEVITFSQNLNCNLNRQIILILESLGIPNEVFLEMQDNIISRFILSDPTIHIKKYCFDFPLTPVFQSERFYLKMFEPVAKRVFEELVKKTRIHVCRGRLLMGILDEYDVLEENEIFIRCSPCIDCICRNEKTLIITGRVGIAKNPCLHPGDVRVVNAVHKSALIHLKDVVVFSRKGQRPVFNMCSGSDLDGDLYFCTWDPRLIPSKQVEPDSYVSKTVLYKQVVSMEDIINFYTRFMRDNQLGLIANAHLALSDKLVGGVNEKECIRLARLFNLGVDFPKTGYVPRLPYDLQPESFPDFMEQYATYRSNKVLGLMYRRIFMFTKLVFFDCECQGHPSSYLRDIHDFQCSNVLKTLNHSFLGRISKIKNVSPGFINTVSGILSFENESSKIFEIYKQEMGLFLFKYGFKSEYDAFLGFNNNSEYDKRFSHGIREITNKFRNLFFKEVKPETIKYKVFSWYKVSHQNCNETILSLPWIMGDVISKHFDSLKMFLTELEGRFHSNLKNVFDPKSSFKGNPLHGKRKLNGIELLKTSGIQYSRFKLNERIVFVDTIEGILSVEKGRKENSYYIYNDFIIIPKYLSIYRLHEDRISNSENMKELFNLFYAIRFFVLENIKYLFEFFVYLSDLERNDPTRNNICNFLIVLSQESYKHREYEKMTGNLFSWIYQRVNETKEHRGNIILLVSFLFSLRHKIGIKLLACENFYFKDKEIHNKYVKAKKAYFHKKPVAISILGMFDVCDLVYMKPYDGCCLQEHSSVRKYTLSLLNPGTCSVVNYKDDLRIFLLQNAAMEKSHLINLKVKIIPGRLYYHSLDDHTSNNNIEIRVVTANTIFMGDTKKDYQNKLSACFINKHPLLEDENREYIVHNQMCVKNKDSYQVLHLMLMNQNYCIYYHERDGIFIVNKITRNRIVNGRFVIMAETDVLFETVQEDIIFCRSTDSNSLHEHEHVLLSYSISILDDLTFVVTSKDKLSNLKLESIKQMSLKSKGGDLIQVILKYIYRNGDVKDKLVLDSQTTSSYCCVESHFNEISFKTFDNFFEEIWRLYEGYFCVTEK